MSDYLDPENEELLKDFFIEAEMQMDTMERTVLAIESDPQDHDSVDELFRAVHTLKGGAYTVQMNELALFTHKVEDLLDEVRNGKLEIGPAITDLLLDSIDVIKEMSAERMAGGMYSQDTTALEKQLVDWVNGIAHDKSRAVKVSAPAAPIPANSAVQEESAAKDPASFPSLLSRAEYDDLLQQIKDSVYQVRVHFDESNPMNTIGSVQEFARLKDLGTIWITHPDFEELYEDNFFEYVDFYLESSAEMSEILHSAMLPDVTLDIEVNLLDETMVQGDLVSEEEESLGSPGSNSLARQDGIATADIATEPVKTKKAAVEAPKSQAPRQARPKKEGGNSSVLRVDSRRVDEILNLVSEAVINKATFNQVNNQLINLVSEMRSTHMEVRDQLNTMIEELLNSSTLRNIDGGSDENLQNTAVRNARKKLQARSAHIHNLFNPLENQLKSIIAQFSNSAANLARNTNDLHESVLSMRMIPISQVFSRFPRLVRDLSRALDKKVDLVLEGEETEIDKSVAEELVDPLMHCVRNSMDHGIENKELRAQANKPENGKIKLSAINEGSNVIIDISDDGAGISLQKVRQKAVENRVIAPNKKLTEQEAFNLIFDPGFSTAKEVSNISGRGVGLDVVKKQIEKLNGTVNVWSEPGYGTRFTIRLPLTLAIIQGLLVRVRTEVYAIPITAVAESIRITPADINLIDNYEVISVRDDVISLLRLNRIFQLEDTIQAPADGYMFVVVVGTEERRVGLMVDNLIGEEDVVIKPLVDRYTHSPGVAGATILGDGIVSLILDVSQLLDLGIQFERFMREQKRF